MFECSFRKSCNSLKLLGALALLALLILPPRAAHATLFTGMGGQPCVDSEGHIIIPAEDGSDYDVPRNWGPDSCHPGSVPGDPEIHGFGVHAHRSLSLGSLKIVGGGLQADGSLSVGSADVIGGVQTGGPATFGRLNLTGDIVSDGSSGGATLTVQNLDWTNGNLSGFDVIIPPGGSANLHVGSDPQAGNNIKQVAGGHFINQGTTTFSGPGALGGIIDNQGVFNIASDGTVAEGFHSIIFNNTGTLAKTGGGGAVNLSYWMTVYNSGTLSANAGAGMLLLGAGDVKDGTVIGGTAASPNDGVLIGGGSTMNGTITVHGRMIMAPSAEAGAITGIATIQGDGLLDWRNSGFNSDPAHDAITLAPGFHTLLNGGDGRPIVFGNTINNGSMVWNGQSHLSGTLTNNGSLELASDGAVASGDAGLVLVNHGILFKNSPGTLVFGPVALTNNGLLDAGAGELDLGSIGGSHTQFQDGSVLEGHVVDLGYGSVFGGNVQIQGALDLMGNSDALFGGNAVLHGPGTLNWMGGRFDPIDDVPVNLTFAPDLTVNVSGDITKQISGAGADAKGRLTNQGTLNWLGGAAITTNTYAQFTNDTGAVLNVRAAGRVLQNGSNDAATIPLTNNGTLNTFPGANDIYGAFSNNGVLNVGGPGKIGVLDFPIGGYAQTAAGQTNLDVAGADPSQFDQIIGEAAGGPAFALGGALRAHPVSDAVTSLPTPLKVVAFADRAGSTFGSVTGGTPAYEDQDLLLTFAPGPPSNDAIANAEAITGETGSTDGEDVLATHESPFLSPGYDEPLIGGKSGGRSVWYKWQAPRDGFAQFDTAGSGFDTLLSAFSSDPVPTYPTFIPLTSDDDYAGATTSRITVAVTKDRTYFVGVDAFNAKGGFLALNWRMGRQVQPGPVAQAITSLQPYATPVQPGQGGSPLTLTVNGTGFTAQSVVYLDHFRHSDVTTTYVSPTQLTVTIPAAPYLTAERTDSPVTVQVATGNQITPSFGLYVADFAKGTAPVGGSATTSTPAKVGFKLQSVAEATETNPDLVPHDFIPVTYHDQYVQQLIFQDNLERQARLAGRAASVHVDSPTATTQVQVTLKVPQSEAPPLVAGAPVALPPGATIISQDGNSIISQDGNSIISQDGNSLHGKAGGGVISRDGAGVISNDGGTLIGQDGNGFAAGGGPSPQQSSPTGWHLVRGSGGARPVVTNANDPDTGEPVGTVSVTFDGTSTPPVTEINGQVFAVVIPKYGDVNGDGKINVSDAILELQGIVGLQALSELQLLNADLAPASGSSNGALFGDGKLDVTDVIRLLRRIVGLEPDPFP